MSWSANHLLIKRLPGVILQTKIGKLAQWISGLQAQPARHLDICCSTNKVSVTWPEVVFQQQLACPIALKWILITKVQDCLCLCSIGHWVFVVPYLLTQGFQSVMILFTCFVWWCLAPPFSAHLSLQQYWKGTKACQFCHDPLGILSQSVIWHVSPLERSGSTETDLSFKKSSLPSQKSFTSAANHSSIPNEGIAIWLQLFCTLIWNIS